MIKIIKENRSHDDAGCLDSFIAAKMRKGLKNGKIINLSKNLIKGATLLSKEEYEEYENNITEIRDIWWLRTGSSKYSDSAYNVSRLSFRVDANPVDFDFLVARPVLIINNRSNNISLGDKFEFGGYTFTMISNKLALCDDNIGRCPFRTDSEASNANIYEKSDVKKFVDNWFSKSMTE